MTTGRSVRIKLYSWARETKGRRGRRKGTGNAKGQERNGKVKIEWKEGGVRKK